MREVYFVDIDIIVVDEMKIVCSKYKKNLIFIILEIMKFLYLEYFGMKDEDIRNRKLIFNESVSVSKLKLCL